MKKQLKLYKTCRTIPVYNFFMAQLTKDCRFLIKNFDDEKDEKKYLEYVDSKELGLILSELMIDYSALIADKKAMKIRKLEYDILFLRGQYDIVSKILNLYKDTGVVEVLDILNDLDIPFNSEKKIKPQITKAIRKAKTFKNKINIYIKRLKDLTKSVSKIDKENNKEDFMIDLDKTALYLETNLELGYQLNIKKITIERWTNLQKMNSQKLERVSR